MRDFHMNRTFIMGFGGSKYLKYLPIFTDHSELWLIPIKWVYSYFMLDKILNKVKDIFILYM